MAGYTRAFNAGANITGNFVYNNNSSGANELGNLANLTLINGTINMNVNLSPVNTIIMSRIINQTPVVKSIFTIPKGLIYKMIVYWLIH